MAVAKTYSAQLIGLLASLVTVEVDIANGLNNFSIVGLGDRSVSEAKDRISAAIKNSGFVSPKQKNQKVVISLAPADIRKEGSVFDLAMALSYLCAAGDISFEPAGVLFLGELSLEGQVRRIGGLLPILCQARALGFSSAFVPAANRDEASLARGLDIYAVSSLHEIVGFFAGERVLEPVKPVDLGRIRSERSTEQDRALDMSVIRGNESCKRALEVAAAGAHNVLMVGPPGTGKTMLAQSFLSILPPLSYDEAVEATGIHSAAGMLSAGFVTGPPFRAPHHTSSYAAIVGGGPNLRPGEITLAHRGVLFMDEFAEFDRSVIDAMRQPLEDKVITISRARGSMTFPAHCILLASMNPCPCGKGRDGGCICPDNIVAHYKRRISGPIIDRFDLWLSVDKVDYDKMGAGVGVGAGESGDAGVALITAESSATIRERVVRARALQVARCKRSGLNKKYNSELSADDIQRSIDMTAEARTTLTLSARRFELSGRAFHRVIKVARTLADLGEKEAIDEEHILEALQYRGKLQEY